MSKHPPSPSALRAPVPPLLLRGRVPYVVVLLLLVVLFTLGSFRSSSTYQSSSLRSSMIHDDSTETSVARTSHASGGPFRWLWSPSRSSTARVPGRPIMGRMANETLKAELGRAAWKLLHTMTVKFPVEPTEAERTLVLDYIYAFAQLYPCGDCARHFRLVLEDHPPDPTSRDTLALWGCTVHNVVNERLKKPLYDCSLIQKDYQCGCAEDEDDTTSNST